MTDKDNREEANFKGEGIKFIPDGIDADEYTRYYKEYIDFVDLKSIIAFKNGTDYKEGFDKYIDYRKKLKVIINSNMGMLNRTGIRVKKTNHIDLCTAYVALMEGCTQVRAKQSIISLGIDPLKYIEIHDIDSDIVDEFKDIYPYALFSHDPAIKSMVSMIEGRKVFNLSDFRSESLWMWEDDAGYISTFSDRYGINSPSVCYNAFYLGIDKLITYHGEYATLTQEPGINNAIEEARSIGTQINGFRASFLKIVHL